MIEFLTDKGCIQLQKSQCDLNAKFFPPSNIKGICKFLDLFVYLAKLN